MKQILFVDDEPQVLDALRDALRKRRHEWNMIFCSSGADALQAIATNAFDVILCDMRMPVMDGAEVLRRVKQDSPATVRIVLSGQADRDLVLRTLPASQQFLAKPMSTEKMIAVIERACELRALLNDAAVRALVGAVEALPSIPATYWQLNELLAGGDAGIAEISALAERDSALSAKLLQIVNSAYFGFAKPVSSVASAVNYVGVDLLKAMALMVGIFQLAPRSVTVVGFSVEESQQQALLVAQIARRIVTDQSRRDEAFTTGVLHDVGKLILATRVPESYAAILRDGILSEKPMHQLETEALGASHALIGAVLLGAWGLPYSMVQSVAYHHNLRSHRAIDDPVTVAVHVADALVSAHLSGRRDSNIDLDVDALSEHGLLPQLQEWTEIAQSVMQCGAAV